LAMEKCNMPARIVTLARFIVGVLFVWIYHANALCAPRHSAPLLALTTHAHNLIAAHPFRCGPASLCVVAKATWVDRVQLGQVDSV
jgi:hypothetical protein